MIVTLYLGLLTAGITFFLLSYIAMYQLSRMLRRQYPQYWKIIAVPETDKPSRLRTWMRLQHALRSPALLALGDVPLTRWRSVWRYSPWLGWLCWFAAISMRLLTR
ncbi:MAG: hypothetical protein ABI114_02910 [Rhodanobacter sp.]